MNRLHFGIVGAGLIARSHMISLARVAGVTLSVYDTDATRARTLADEFDATACDSLDALTAGVDLVWVCTPPIAHREAIDAAITAGKSVFCEKPLAATTEEAQAIADAVEASGIPFYMGHSGRWMEAFRLMHQLTREGKVGNPTRVWSRRFGYLDPAIHPAWRLDDKYGGGAVVELGVHEIDFIRWIGDNWARVSAIGRSLISPDFQDTIVAIGELQGGAAAHLELCWTSPRYLFQRGVEGTEGALFIDDARIMQVELHRPGKDVEIHHTREDWQDHETKENFSLRDQAAAVIDSIRYGQAYPVGVADGMAAVRAANAMRLSAAEGRWVDLEGSA